MLARNRGYMVRPPGPLSAAQTALIQELIARHWDGRDILEGITSLAATAEMRTLTDRLKLNSVRDRLRRSLPYSG